MSMLGAMAAALRLRGRVHHDDDQSAAAARTPEHQHVLQHHVVELLMCFRVLSARSRVS